MAKRFWGATNTATGKQTDFQTEAEAQAFADRVFTQVEVDPVTFDVIGTRSWREPHLVAPTGLEAQCIALAAQPGITVPFDRITINRWKTDTCGCVVEQWTGDDDEPRVVRYAAILHRGPEHTAAGETLYDAIKGENQRKNTTLAIVEALTDKATRDDATTWAFTTDRLPGSDERVLEVTIAGTNKQQRDSVAGAADVQFGTGAVKVL